MNELNEDNKALEPSVSLFNEVEIVIRHAYQEVRIAGDSQQWRVEVMDMPSGRKASTVCTPLELSAVLAIYAANDDPEACAAYSLYPIAEKVMARLNSNPEELDYPNRFRFIP